MYIKTEKDGETVVAVADSKKELAELTGVSISAVCHGLKKKSRLYHYVPDDEEEGEG